MGSVTCCFSRLIHPTPSPPLRGEGICAQPFCSLSTFSSGLIFDSEIVELFFEKVLCREACVAQIAIDMTPFFYATVIKEAQVFGDDEWHDTILQALPKHQQSPNTTVAVLKWVYAFKSDMESQDVVL